VLRPYAQAEAIDTTARKTKRDRATLALFSLITKLKLHPRFEITLINVRGLPCFAEAPSEVEGSQRLFLQSPTEAQ